VASVSFAACGKDEGFKSDVDYKFVSLSFYGEPLTDEWLDLTLKAINLTKNSYVRFVSEGTKVYLDGKETDSTYTITDNTARIQDGEMNGMLVTFEGKNAIIEFAMSAGTEKYKLVFARA